MTDAVLIAHALSTTAMAGLIWFVQIVHYPMFARVGSEGFSRYALEHQARTTVVVLPLMLTELVSAVWLGFTLATPVAWAGVVLVAMVWASTFLLQVPIHARLGSGFDARLVRRLVLTNWVRTALWSARAYLAVLMLVD